MTKDTKKEKNITKKYVAGLKPLGIYFLIYAATISLSELFIRYQISGSIKSMNLYFLLFVPAEAMFFTAFTGFFKNIGNKITLPIILLIIDAYYCVQFVYYRIFGSLFSVAMMGMGGTAVGNFFWAMEEILIASIALLTIFLAPAFISVFLALVKKLKFKGYTILLHVFVLGLAVGFWFIGILGLKAFGTGHDSAYYVFSDGSSDTDTSAASLGTMTTFLVESGAYYLGIGSSKANTDLNVISSNDLVLLPDEPEVTEPKPSGEADVEDEPEVIEEEIVYDPWVDERFDFEALANNTSDKNLQNIYSFMAQSEPSYKNEYTGLFEGYNLIYICAEGFWKYACDETVTPTLYKMSHNGIVLENYYNSFLNTTTNGEFAFATSLWPDVSRYAMSGTDVGSFPQSASKFMPYGLGDMFKTIDVPTYAYHNYYGTYYRRYLSWPNLGYDNLKFMGDMKFTTTWPSSDFEMMEQSIDDYIENDQFHSYYMTFSGHGPYNSANCIANRNREEVKALLGEKADTLHSEALNYYACNYELEKAMTYLLERLEEAGKLDNTVIVLTGDHYPYYLSEEGRNSLAGEEISGLEQYHSNCIIYNSAIEEPIINENYCCNVDIVPTMLNLFNIPFDSRLLMGTDVFSDSPHTAVLYNKSFLNDTVEYDTATKEKVWKIDTSHYCEEALDAYINNFMSLNDSKYLASINFLKYNFYLNLYKDAGLLTEEEIAAEKTRSDQVIATNTAQNEKEAEEARIKAEEEAAAAAAAAAAAEAEAQAQGEN